MFVESYQVSRWKQGQAENVHCDRQAFGNNDACLEQARLPTLVLALFANIQKHAHESDSCVGWKLDPFGEIR